MDNLSVKPHAFTEGDTLNKMSDADLVAIISHGGPALNKSAEMPPWGYTLSKSDIAALVSYIRAVADPPYEAGGLVYAQKVVRRRDIAGEAENVRRMKFRVPALLVMTIGAACPGDRPGRHSHRIE